MSAIKGFRLYYNLIVLRLWNLLNITDFLLPILPVFTIVVLNSLTVGRCKSLKMTCSSTSASLCGGFSAAAPVDNKTVAAAILPTANNINLRIIAPLKTRYPIPSIKSVVICVKCNYLICSEYSSKSF